MPALDATTQAVLIQIVFFALSIVGAWIVLILLKGSANIRHKGAQFGGAAAMFVAMFVLLNKYVPEMRDGIVAEAKAGQTQKLVARSEGGTVETLDVYLSPERQKITLHDLKGLDRNKYHIDEQMGVAVRRPDAGDWSVGTLPSFDSIGISDLPILTVGLDTLSSMQPVGKKTRPTFAIRSVRGREITVDADSEIGGIKADTNPFADVSFLQRAVEAQVEATARMGALPVDLSDEAKKKQAVAQMVSLMGPTMKSGFDKYIEKTLPIRKKVHNGVYVTTIEIADLPAEGVFGQLFKGMSALDRSINILAMKGVMAGGGRNLKIDQQKQIASFDGSVRLQRATVDGSKSDLTLNDIGFIVVGNQRIVFVQLVCLDIDGLSTSLLLKRIMDTLLFVA